jgi:hypothetical protein
MPASRSWNNRSAKRACAGRAAWRCAATGAFALSSAAAVTIISGESRAQSAGASTYANGLIVAIVDLREIPAFAPRPEQETRRPTWRTTFGSERATEPEIKAVIAENVLAPVAGADVVLIQGVQASAPLRRLFPPRDWRLVVSRRILSPTDPVGFRTARSDLPRTTAIAVKAREDLRITARALSLALHEPETASGPDQADAAATAVRLSDGNGRSVWLASIVLPSACGVAEPPCPALGKLDAWRQEKLKGGEPTLIGGRIIASVPPTAEDRDNKQEICASHAIESDLAWERLPLSEKTNDIPTGCISVVRLGK